MKIPQEKMYSMEAVGINVIKTLINDNIDFELKPKNKVVLVCLLFTDTFLKLYMNSLQKFM